MHKQIISEIAAQMPELWAVEGLKDNDFFDVFGPGRYDIVGWAQKQAFILTFGKPVAIGESIRAKLGLTTHFWPLGIQPEQF